MARMRSETDSLGEVAILSDSLWGAQTQRSRLNFAIGGERIPLPRLRAIAIIKIAAARVNVRMGLLDTDLAKAIEHAA